MAGSGVENFLLKLFAKELNALENGIVFVVAGDRAKAVEVGLGAREKEWLEVTGLPAGTKVITSGQSQLVDGSLIRVR